MPINKKELTKMQVMKAMQCKTVDELIALAKAGGYEITKDEAEAYLAELADVELDDKQLKKVAGGGCYPDCPKDYCFEN
jgi:predicted ribosomally synthesized peptide with nif11-like leader